MVGMEIILIMQGPRVQKVIVWTNIMLLEKIMRE